MKPFRFRAAGALEVRRKQEDAAREARAAADAVRVRAVQAAQDADATVRHEGERLAEAQRGGIAGWELGWHRSWIAKLRHDADLRRRDVSQAEADVQRADAAVREAYRRRRTLERWRDRALRRHQQAVHQQDAREMNALAGMRFLARAAEQGEGHGEYDDRSHGNGRDTGGRG